MGYRDWNTIFRTIVFFLLNLFSIYCILGYVRKGTKKRWYRMLERAKWQTSDHQLVAGLLISMFSQALYMNYCVLAQDPVWDLLIVYTFQWSLPIFYGYMVFIRQKFAAAIILILLKVILLFVMGIYFVLDAQWSTLYLLPDLAWTCYFGAINIYIADNNSEEEQKPFWEIKMSDYNRK